MNLKPYLDYFKYVCEHKKNVFIECMKDGLFLRAFTHDLSKFRPSEFIPYARYFYIDKKRYQEAFDKAWELHYKRNKHHPEYAKTVLICIPGSKPYERYEDMALNDIREMICDLKAMSRKFGGSAQEYYLKNYHEFDMSLGTRRTLDYLLGLSGTLYIPTGCKRNIPGSCLLEIVNDASDKDGFNTSMKSVVKRYPELDIYELVKKPEAVN